MSRNLTAQKDGFLSFELYFGFRVRSSNLKEYDRKFKTS